MIRTQEAIGTEAVEMFLVDGRGLVCTWNPTLAKWTGLDAETAVGSPAATPFRGSGPDLVAARKNGSWTGRLQLESPATQVLELQVSARSLPTPHDPDTIGLALTPVAIADQEEIAQALAHVGCFQWEVREDILTWSEEMYRIYQAEKETFGGNAAAFFERVHPDDRSRILQAVEAGLEAGTYEFFERIVRPDGSIRHLHTNGKVIRDANGEPIRVIGACQDITDRRDADQSLQWQVQGLTLLTAMAAELVENIDPELQDSELVRRICDHLGCNRYARRRAEGGALVDVGNLDETAAAVAQADAMLAQECIEEGSPCYWGAAEIAARPDLQALTGSGVRRYAVLPLTAAGTVVGTLALASGRDTPFSSTEREFIETVGGLVAAAESKRRILQDLQGEEIRYRQLLDSVADSIFVLDRSGRFVDVNEAACTSLGYSRRELLRLSVRDIEVQALPPGMSFEEWRATCGQRVLSGTHQRKDGSRFPVEVRSNPGVLAGQPRTIALARDITERKQLEEQLIHSQKMEAVGRLAGGVAHDFNNLLTVINTTADLLLLDLEPEQSLHESVLAIQSAGIRAANLTAQLLVLGRKSPVSPGLVDLSQITQELSNLLHRAIGEDIDVRIDLADDLPHIHADSGQIEQIIMNLAVNARDAMPGGGRLEIRTSIRFLPCPTLPDLADMPPGQFVEVSVRDSGCGIDESVRRRIFEPFFTTKDVGQGTGLGLSVVYGIVTGAGGRVVVESQLLHGTTFRLLFPVARTDAPATAGGPSSGRTEGEEIVLLVEDENLVRRAAKNALERAGYKVIEAHCAEVALEIASHRLDDVSLLLTDVVMPGMDGCELATTLVQQLPSLRVLYMSGYSENTINRRGQLSEADLLRKPFTARSLVERVRRAIDAPAH